MYLDECFKSIEKQGDYPYEVLCIDDYSVDGSVDLIEKYAKTNDRFKLIQDSNCSYGHKINVGIQNARGLYICILESDDYYSDNFLKTIDKIISVYSPDIVDGDFCQFKEFANQKISKRVYKYEYPIMYDKICFNNMNIRSLWSKTSAIWTGAYNKDFLISNNIQLNESEGASYQDTSFRFLTSAFASTRYTVDEILYYYRVDNSGSSVKNNDKVFSIVGEYDYLYNQLSLRKTQNDIWEHYFRWKATGYLWNVNRLNEDGVRTFIPEIEKFFEANKSIFLKSIQNGLGEFHELINLLSNPDTFIKDTNNKRDYIQKEIKKLENICLTLKDECFFIVRDEELQAMVYRGLPEPWKDNIKGFIVDGNKENKVDFCYFPEEAVGNKRCKYITLKSKSCLNDLLCKLGAEEEQLVYVDNCFELGADAIWW